MDRLMHDDLKLETVLAIKIDKKGGVHVTGCIDDKTMAYGLLETARDLVYEHNVRRIITNGAN